MRQIDPIRRPLEHQGPGLVAEAVLPGFRTRQDAVILVAAGVAGVSIEGVVGDQWGRPLYGGLLRLKGRFPRIVLAQERLHLGRGQHLVVYPEIVQRPVQDLVRVEVPAQPVLLLADDQAALLDRQRPVLEVSAKVGLAHAVHVEGGVPLGGVADHDDVMPLPVRDRRDVHVTPPVVVTLRPVRIEAEDSLAQQVDDVLVVLAPVGGAHDGLAAGLGGLQPEGDAHVPQAVEHLVGQIDPILHPLEHQGPGLVAESVLPGIRTGQGAVIGVGTRVPGVSIERIVGYQSPPGPGR